MTEQLYDIPPTKCPACGYTITVQGTTRGKDDNEPPKEDDYTICMKCFIIMQFNKDLSLRKATYIPIVVELERRLLMRLHRKYQASMN